MRVDGATAIVGITDYAQGELGDVIYIDITPGRTVKQNETFGTVEAVKTVSDLLSPVAGTITEVNQGAVDAPELVNKDPYGAGWLVKLAIEDAGQIGTLLSVADYKKLIGQG